jgi:hypothetical protein
MKSTETWQFVSYNLDQAYSLEHKKWVLIGLLQRRGCYNHAGSYNCL